MDYIGVTEGLQKKRWDYKKLGSRITKKKASGLQKITKKNRRDYNPLPSLVWAYLRLWSLHPKFLRGQAIKILRIFLVVGHPRDPKVGTEV